MSNDHVQVQITVVNTGITRAGFGKPLILSHNATFPERSREYGDIADVAVDFDSDTPEYLAAAAFLGQNPKPPKLLIGRATAEVTQKYVIALGTNGVQVSHAYKILVEGTGFDAITLTYTSADDDEEADILAGITALLEGVTDKNFDAAVAGSTIEVTGSDPGNWFSLEMKNTADLAVAQTHTVDDSDLTDDLDAIRLDNDSWYELTTLYNSKDYVASAATWANSNLKLYVFDVNETDAIKTEYDEDTSTDSGATMAIAGYSYVAACYHPRPAAMFAAAWMGRWLPTDPGTATAKFKTLEGPAVVTLNPTDKVNLRARRMNSYTSEFGRPITWEGTVASTVYRFIDVRRDVDWLSDEVTKAVFGVLAGSDKVPYTATGIAQIEGAVRGSVSLAVAAGVLAEGTTAVSAPDIADVDASDKSDRILKNVKFSGTLTGAVHAVIPVLGTVTF